MISGPNMGGKTVTLKTIGLFVALAHAAFPVIAYQAHMPYYTDMWFDIGDQQSISNNLSTFSGHISKIAQICQNANEHSFVLIDELGNGTDPLEGASLAIAVIQYLIQQKCTTITSTHFNQVKSFGKTNPHVLIASVEFDGETLRPTYRYLPGISGASYAFSIADSYDLLPEIIEEAKEIKEQNTKNVERELEKLEVLQRDVQKKQERFDTLIADAHRIQKEAKEDKEKWDAQKHQMALEYEQSLNEMLEEKREQADAMIQDMRQSQTGKMHEQAQLLHELSEMQQPISDTKQADDTLQAGDYVRITDLNSHGEILEIRRKEATVLTNGMKMKVKLNRLERMKRPQPKTVSQKANVQTTSRFPLELNLIGMRVQEAIEELDHYLDQAVVHKVNQVRIVHGVGSGALRAAVWDDLSKQTFVKDKQSAPPNQGGLGATIVILR